MDILFIGNSYTYVTGGIDRQMKGLAPGSASSVIAGGGCTLSDNYLAGDVLQNIRQRGWDYVVLQEHNPTHILDPEKCVNAVRDVDMVGVGQRRAQAPAYGQGTL